MGHTFINRRAAAAVVAAIGLGIAAPAAGARPFDLNSTGSFVQVGSTQTRALNASQATGHNNGGGDISGWGFVAIGSGVASLAFIGVGGTRAARHRRQRQRAAVQPKIAA
jgi:hypothetical protein